MTDRVKQFDSRQSATSEGDYLAWRLKHPTGFVVNIDKRHSMTQYPMVHRVRDRQLSAEKNKNFTTGAYYKLCASELRDLEQYCQAEFNRPLAYCRRCKPAGDGLEA